MKFFSLATLLLATVTAAFASDSEPPKELKIESVEVPKECTQQAGTGDLISVHYVSTTYGTVVLSLS
jgi:hypothetical protein